MSQEPEVDLAVAPLRQVPDGPTFSVGDLQSVPLKELIQIGREIGVEIPAGESKRTLMLKILGAQSQQMPTQGVLEVLRDGFGFLRGSETSYLSGPDDIYVGPALVSQHALRSGDTLTGLVRAPRRGERYFSMSEVHTINGADPGQVVRRSFYDDLTPLHPDAGFRLEHAGGSLATRVLDMLCPLGKGQRALIVSPPRAGKTVLLQDIAHAITASHPEVELLVLLIDERPEEVTDMRRSVGGEVVASTFDEPASRHTKVAAAMLAKAQRMAEQGRDVVILLDSITRLARAYNTTTRSSGRVLSGGLDARALQKPKRFFGAARNIEEGGSLTILATALIETGSRMDDVIFEEFKGTGNAEIVLERGLTDRRIWPAIDVNRSGTRKEELLVSEEILSKIWVLRRISCSRWSLPRPSSCWCSASVRPGPTRSFWSR